MEVRIGGGRTLSVTIEETDRINIDGIMYQDSSSLTFYERGGDEVTVFFRKRDRLKKLAEDILEAIANGAFDLPTEQLVAYPHTEGSERC
jgi:hypothetical protein